MITLWPEPEIRDELYDSTVRNDTSGDHGQIADQPQQIDEKEAIIQEYITYLSEARDLEHVNRDVAIKIELHGMGTDSSALPTKSLEEAEAERYASVAVQQHHLVMEQFGSDAWENVTYTLEETDPVDGKMGYRMVSTGELVSESEYDRFLREYWEEVAEKEGVTYDDIFLADDEPAEMMENKRVDIIAKYADDIPVQLTTISDAQTYRVNLSFNGQRVSDQKHEDFHFIIDNRKGYWTVFQGLTWAAPYPEYPEGD